jgi:hypothetical protein
MPLDRDPDPQSLSDDELAARLPQGDPRSERAFFRRFTLPAAVIVHRLNQDWLPREDPLVTFGASAALKIALKTFYRDSAACSAKRLADYVREAAETVGRIYRADHQQEP